MQSKIQCKDYEHWSFLLLPCDELAGVLLRIATASDEVSTRQGGRRASVHLRQALAGWSLNKPKERI
ncbi:MAG: hypothetical protein HY298_00390 [Verrucomicrobia bacterium]|nr:hypothetical protein [Verrucomicrobiota bacterium]